MGFLDLFRKPPEGKRRRVLADIRRGGDETQLWFRGERLSLEALAPGERASLSRWPTTIVIEADLEARAGTWVVMSLGETRAHPRTAALRAVADLRFSHALASLEELGDAVEVDPELLVARLHVYARTARNDEAEADFSKLLAHPGLTLEAARLAYESLWSAELHERCGAAMAGFAEQTDKTDRVGGAIFTLLLGTLPRAHWGSRLPLLAMEEQLADRDPDLETAETFLAAVKGTAPDTVVAAATEQIARARKAQLAKEVKAARALLAARPDFDAVEQSFNVKLPSALRSAWEAHYEGRTVGFGFIAVKKDKLDKLADLARKLERALEPGERHPVSGRPHQLLPFGEGEHEGDYFALDLSQPADAGDFAVRGIFNRGTGGGVLAYASSVAWLAANGMPRY
ncbi:MAG: SMI1/KNR4 family protein [Archangium sp.]|nr:SMI1/KNR4 family protein [Archangium sp.]